MHKAHKELLEENRIGKIIIDKSLKIHKVLGPGLLESAYQECLKYELLKAGCFVLSEKPLPLVYEELTLDKGYRIDLLINHKVIVEIKSVESITDVHIAQTLTYMKLSGCRLGYVLNFHVKLFKDGIRRLIL